MRPGLTRISVPNEGLTVFLYDKAHVKAIRAGMPAFWGNRSGRSARDAERVALAADGTLVMYELYQDDDVDVAVGVGEPLTEEERAGRTWGPPRTALLHLPTGTLHVDSWSTLRAHPTDRPERKGATITVPPGRYLLTLHRQDQSSGEAVEGPAEVITLTPTTRERVDDAPPELAISADASPAGTSAGRVADGRWVGCVAAATAGERPSIALDMDEDAAAALGLGVGARLRLEAGGCSYTMVHLGSPSARRAWRRVHGEAALQALASDPALECWMEGQGVPAAGAVEGLEEWLRVSAIPGGAAERSALFALPAGTAATVRVETPAPPAEVPAARLVKGALAAQVLASHPGAMAVSADFPAIRKLKLAADEPPVLELGDRAWELYDAAALVATERGRAAAERGDALRHEFVKWPADESRYVLLVLPVRDPDRLPPGAPPAPPVPVAPTGTTVRLRRP